MTKSLLEFLSDFGNICNTNYFPKQNLQKIFPVVFERKTALKEEKVGSDSTEDATSAFESVWDI